MGGSDNKNLDHNMTVKRCLAFDNRVKGFDQNNNKGSMTLYNNSSYRNATNYSVSSALDSGKVLTIINCLSYGYEGPIGAFAIQATNSWLSPFVVDTSDFVTLDTTGVRGPRQPDGSLPDVPFMHLVAGSDLIDAGTDVGMPYLGTAPDLGSFEYQPPTSVHDKYSGPAIFHLDQNYPNPFNPSTIIRYELVGNEHVLLTVCNLLGQKVVSLVDGHQSPGVHTVTFDGSALSGGVYFCRLQAGTHVETRTMILLK
jgi:hypothetical protein